MKKSAYLKTMFQTYGNEITVYPKYKKEYQVKGFIRPLSFQHLPSSNELGIPFDHTDDGGYLYLCLLYTSYTMVSQVILPAFTVLWSKV